MADIFVSYTSSDRDWAFWIGQELEKLGHVARIHEWEIAAGGDISRWMEERHDSADHILCVISEAYLKAPYSSWERRAAQWAATTKRPNFAVPVFIESCEAPTLLAPIKRCDLYGLNEEYARVRLADFMKSPARPIEPVSFPGAKKVAMSGGAQSSRAPVAFPGQTVEHGSATISNIPITVPRHFLGRDEDLAAIGAELKYNNGRVAITALHGLRGVGKTTLAVAYAGRNRSNYRATWWIRAEAESTMRADLVGLGVRLGWVAADEKEEPALAAVLERLRDNGDGILLVYDNAKNANEIRPYMPRIGAAHAIVTSNAPDWGGVAAPVEIEVWPNEVGADYLTARTGRNQERQPALTLSEALGGLPLAHEQAAAYCERIGISFVEYLNRFNTAPTRLLDAEKDAPAEYHDRMTVAKTFALAIDQAAKLHPSAERLIVYAAHFAPEPIPLFLFSEAREEFGEPLASTLANDGLDEAVAALRTFALVDREAIVDERDPKITTDCIRLHRLVREVAVARCVDSREDADLTLMKALVAVFPEDFIDLKTWPRARRLDPLAQALISGNRIPKGGEQCLSEILNALGLYRQTALGAYVQAREFYQRALTIDEQVLGPEHPHTGTSLNNLAGVLQARGDFVDALPLLERALAISEKHFGAEDAETATSLNNLGVVLRKTGDPSAARPLYERALRIQEKVLGPEHPLTVVTLNNLGFHLQQQGELADAKTLYERVLTICEKSPGHLGMAEYLSNFASLLVNENPARAQQLYERALALREQILGSEHPATAMSLARVAVLLQAKGALADARPLYESALAKLENAFGLAHPDAEEIRGTLAMMLAEQGDIVGARQLCERILAIDESMLGVEHPKTNRSRNILALLVLVNGQPAEALALGERALAVNKKLHGLKHSDTKDSARVTADALDVLGRTKKAAALRRKYSIND